MYIKRKSKIGKPILNFGTPIQDFGKPKIRPKMKIEDEITNLKFWITKVGFWNTKHDLDYQY